MSVFVFKHFRVKQERSAMKIGTDSVLLGCVADVSGSERILDIGTGTGILALMMAQRSHAIIDAVEYDEDAFSEAKFNFKESLWNERLNIYHQTIQSFAAETGLSFDLIITNPPYYVDGENSLINNEQRSKARHTTALSFSELIECVSGLLTANGSFWLILPVTEAALFLRLCEDKLYLNKQINIKPKAGRRVNRVVMEWGLNKKETVIEELTVYNDDNSPSLNYKLLAKDFYTGKQFEL